MSGHPTNLERRLLTERNRLYEEAGRLRGEVERLQLRGAAIAGALEREEERNADLEARVRELEAAIRAVHELINQSEGVIGLHPNGDVAPWDELMKGGRFEEWLAALAAVDAEGKQP